MKLDSKSKSKLELELELEFKFEFEFDSEQVTNIWAAWSGENWTSQPVSLVIYCGKLVPRLTIQTIPFK